MFSQKHNWPRLIGSVLLLIAGVIGIANPGFASVVIVVLIGAALMIAGALQIGFYLSGSKLASGWDMLTGVLDIIGAFIVLVNGTTSLRVLAVLAGVYVIVQGILSVYNGFRARGRTGLWKIGVIWGALAMLLGLLLVIYPLSLAVGIGVFLGIYMGVMGVMGIVRFFMEQKSGSDW